MESLVVVVVVVVIVVVVVVVMTCPSDGPYMGDGG